MRRILRLFLKRHAVLLLFLLTFLSISALCQPPVTVPTQQSVNQQSINDVLPNGVDPTQMTQKNFNCLEVN